MHQGIPTYKDEVTTEPAKSIQRSWDVNCLKYLPMLLYKLSGFFKHRLGDEKTCYTVAGSLKLLT